MIVLRTMLWSIAASAVLVAILNGPTVICWSLIGGGAVLLLVCGFALVVSTPKSSR